MTRCSLFRCRTTRMPSLMPQSTKLRKGTHPRAKAHPCGFWGLLSPLHEGRQAPGVQAPQRQAMLGLHVGQQQLQHLVGAAGSSGLLLLPVLSSLQDGQQVQQAQQHCLGRDRTPG